MSASLAQASPGHGPINRTLTLVGLFWGFSYALLTIRGALFHDDWTRLIDNNRLLAVTFGAGAYFLVLRQLKSGHDLTLRRAVAWVVGATLGVMVVRFSVDAMMFDAPQPIEVHLLWSLTWSAYFALWVMGSLAFPPAPAPEQARPTTVVPLKAVPTIPPNAPAKLDNIELMVISIMAEAADLKSSDRAELAARVLEIGGYESFDGSARDNERSRLALRLAARLAAPN